MTHCAHIPPCTGKYTLECTQAKLYTRMCTHVWSLAEFSQTTHTLYLSHTQSTCKKQPLGPAGLLWFFSPLCPDEMFIVSNTLWKNIHVRKRSPSWKWLPLESSMSQLWDMAHPRTWPGCSSNVPPSSSWGLMLCTSTLPGQLPRAFNPQRYDTMLNIVSSISLLLFFRPLSLVWLVLCYLLFLSNWPSHLSIFNWLVNPSSF